MKYILALAVLIGVFCFPVQAQTPLLQALIDATPAGGTLTLPSDVVYPCNCVINKPITIVSSGARVVTTNADPAIAILPNTDNVTLRGLDISATGFVHDIVRIGGQGAEQDTFDEAPANITLDAVLVHGDPLSDSQRGVAANGSNVSILNSRIYEIHGRGFDTQAIGVWNGPGPFRIINTYLEAAGENVMFGGAVPSIPGLIPTDIQILNCYFFKPLSWKPGHPSYAGIHWSVKNLLEFKNARNVVVDGNTLENCWTDAQIGYAVLFTVRSEDGQALWTTVENVRFTNNLVKNSEQGFQFLGLDAIPSQRGNTVLVFNNRFQGTANRFVTISGFYNVTFEHNTHEQGGNIISFHGEPSLGFVWRNSATFRNPNGYGIFGDGIGEGKSALEAYAPGSFVQGNVIAGAPEWIYPGSNFYPTDLSTLSSFKGTDGLVPGYLGATSSPSPSPSPAPSVSPTPLASSPNNTRLPPTSQIIDNQSSVWTLSGIRMLRNGQETGGYGSALLWCSSRIYGLGEDSLWWRFENPGWSRVGADPCAVPTPTPTPVASPSPSPSATPTPSASPTPTPKPSPSPSPTPCKRLPNGKCRK